MKKSKTYRNQLIVKMVQEGVSMSKIAKELGLKAKSTIHEIYWREVKRSEEKKLSTVETL